MTPRLLTAALAFALVAPIAAAQDAYRPVEPVPMPLDRAGVWTFHFAYAPPRIITVDTPDGRKRVWYMVYKVWNKTDSAERFVPEFELVTKDGKLQSFLDEPYPSVAQQIRKIEDPTGALNIRTTTEIAKEKIPVTKPDSVPRAVHGVAIWADAPANAATTNNFSVYVTGLSNGNAVQEREGAPDSVSRKTLQIDFIRPTDANNPMSNDIRPNDNNGLGAWKWIYRVVPTLKPVLPGADK